MNMEGHKEVGAVNCNHKYVNLEDGSFDKFCVRCCNRFKQAMADIPKFETVIKLSDPSMIGVPTTIIFQDGVIEKLAEQISQKKQQIRNTD